MLILAETTAVEFCSKMSDLLGVLGTFITIFKIVIPIILIIYGMLDMGKAVTSGKEDEIKKQALSFFRRALAAIVVFFIPSIVGLIMTFVNNAGGKGANDYCQCIKSLQLTSTC